MLEQLQEHTGQVVGSWSVLQGLRGQTMPSFLASLVALYLPASALHPLSSLVASGLTFPLAPLVSASFSNFPTQRIWYQRLISPCWAKYFPPSPLVNKPHTLMGDHSWVLTCGPMHSFIEQIFIKTLPGWQGRWQKADQWCSWDLSWGLWCHVQPYLRFDTCLHVKKQNSG